MLIGGKQRSPLPLVRAGSGERRLPLLTPEGLRNRNHLGGAQVPCRGRTHHSLLTGREERSLAIRRRDNAGINRVTHSRRAPVRRPPKRARRPGAHNSALNATLFRAAVNCRHLEADVGEVGSYHLRGSATHPRVGDSRLEH